MMEKSNTFSVLYNTVDFFMKNRIFLMFSQAHCSRHIMLTYLQVEAG